MWTPVDTEFFGPKTPIAIACVHDSNGFAYRPLLESLGAATLLHNIGTPGDFLKVLAQEDTAPPFLVISGHGGNQGIVFGDYVKGIDVSMLIDGFMPPHAIAVRVRPPGCAIVHFACDGGTREK